MCSILMQNCHASNLELVVRHRQYKQTIGWWVSYVCLLMYCVITGEKDR